MPDSALSPSPLPAWKRSLPNALTMARVVLAAAFFVMLGGWSYDLSPLAGPAEGDGGPDPWLWAAAAVFVVAAATDALDGMLARRWRVVSVFGRIMDPFADKVLVIGAFVMLAGPEFAAHGWWPGSSITPWMAVVVLARELLVTSIRAAYESRGVDFSATVSGKVKMILQCVCVPGVLVLMNIASRDRAWVGPTSRVLVWTTVIVTAWSGVPYVLRAVRKSKDEIVRAEVKRVKEEAA